MLKITEMFAFISIDADGNEGVIGVSSTMGMLPLVGADMAHMETMKPTAMAVANITGLPVILIKFSVHTELEGWKP